MEQRLRQPSWLIIAALWLVACACAPGAELSADLPLWWHPRGFKTGHLTFSPCLACDLTYTDNVNRTARQTQEDLLAEYAPSFDLRLQPDEAVSLSTAYEFGWHDYLKDNARDYLSHRASGELQLRNLWAEGLGLAFSNQYQQSGNTSALENQILAFTRYHSNQAFAKAQYEFNRFTVSGKYTYGLTDYFARANAGSDYHTHSGTLEGSYSILPEKRLNLFGSYSLLRTLRSISDTSDFDTHTALVGVRGAYSKLGYSVGAGYSSASFLHRDREDNGPSFEASLAYAPHRRLHAAVAASRRFVAGVQTGITTDTNLKATLSLLLTERGKLVFDYTRNDSRYLNGPQQLSLAYTGSFEYKVTRFAVATIGYTRTEREVSTGAGGFVINDAHLGFRLAW